MKFFSNLRRRGLALFLVLTMCMTLLPAQALAAEMEADPKYVTAEEKDPNGPQITKTVSWKDGYKVQMEAYVAGTVTTESTPLDIVLVLDQSGSMGNEDFPMGSYSSWNGGYGYYKRNEYALYQSQRSNGLYVKRVDGIYSKVTVSRNWSNGSYIYTYEADGMQSTTSRRDDGDVPSTWDFYTQDIDTRHAGMQSAVVGFIDKVAEKNSAISDTAKKHRISLVTFGSSAYLRHKLTTETGTVKNTVNNLSTPYNASTNIADGLTKAESELGSSAEGRKKLVILFTDGTPTTDSSFAPSVAASAIETAKTLKTKKNTTIYAISVLNSAKVDVIGGTTGSASESEKTNTFMNAVSSNYPKASATKNPYKVTLNDGSYQNGYYKVASNSTQLNNVFDEISTSIDSISVGKESILYDNMSDFFTLPAGATADSVKVWKVPATKFTTGEDGKKVFTFDAVKDEYQVTDPDVKVTIEGKKIQVTGFDYSSVGENGNCVLPATADKDKASGEATGYKLVIEFPITPNNADSMVWTQAEKYNTNNGAGISTKKDGEDVTFEVNDPTATDGNNRLQAPVTLYGVTYQYTGLPTGKNLYDAQGNLVQGTRTVTNEDGTETTETVTLSVPTDSRQYVTGQTYAAQTGGITKVYEYDAYGNPVKEYTRGAWTGGTSDGKMGEASLTITAQWNEMGLIVGTANVTFTAGSNGKIVNGTDADSNPTYGDVTDSGLVNRPFPTAPAADTAIVAAPGYHFVGWKLNGTGDVVTTWPEKVDKDYSYTAVFEENTKHKVSYSWTGLPTAPYFGTDSVDDTTAVTRQHLADAEVAEGAKYTVDTTDYAVVYTHGTNADGSIFVNGKYAFGGWNDSGEKVMGNQDVAYTGSWTDVTNNLVKPEDPEVIPGLPKYGVTYTVSIDYSENGRAPSEAVKAQLAGINTPVTDDNTYFFNQDVNLAVVENKSVPDTVGRIEYEGTVYDPGVSGTWVFSGWKLDGKDASDPTHMAKGGLHFTATWKFTMNPVYTVKYFQENLSGGYDEVREDAYIGTGAAGATATADEKVYAGFTLNKDASKTSGVITDADNGLVLNLYYDRAPYTVSYTIEGNDYGAATPKVETYKYGETVTVAPVPVVPGYTFNGWNGTEAFVNGTMPAQNVVLTGSFTTDSAAYKVEHYQQQADGSYKLAETENLTGTTDTVVNATPKSYQGYKYSVVKDTVASGMIKSDGSLVLKLYYQPVLTCTVMFMEKGGAPIHDSVTIETGLYVGQKLRGVDVKVLAEAQLKEGALAGWIYDSASPDPLEVKAAGQVVILYYTRPSYTVQYIDQATGKEIEKEITGDLKVKVGDEVKASDFIKSIKGYEYQSADPEVLTIANDGNNVIKLYYAKKETAPSYTVNFYKDSVDNAPFHTVTKQDAVVGEMIPIDGIETPAGYKLGSVDGPLNVGKDSSQNIVSVVFVKRTDLGYTVKYYKDTLEEKNYLGQLSGQGTLGDEIVPVSLSVFAPNGYRTPGAVTGQMTITANEAENVVKVLYTKDGPATYSYKIVYWQDSVDGVCLGISEPKTSNVPVEQVKLTSEELNAKKSQLPEGYKDGVQVGGPNDRNEIDVLYTKETADPTKYTVTYEWTTTPVPEGVYLPIDTNTYAAGDAFSVDSTYKAGDKKVEYRQAADGSYIYEAGAWVFSGWKLDGSEVPATMPEKDIVLQGAWTWERANTYSVTYEWANGRAPAEARLPVGESGLYTGQRFEVAGEPAPIDRVVNGVTLGTWTFLGWTDYKAGAEYTMSRDNVVISGEWEYVPVEIYDKDDPENNDLNVTKTSDDQNVAIGSTVTWIIEIENTRDDMTYSGLSLEEYLTGVYGQEALTGENSGLRISGEYHRSTEKPYIGFGAEAVTLLDAIDVPDGEETTNDEIITNPEIVTMPEQETETETEPEIEIVPEIPAAFNPDTQIMSRGFAHFSNGSDDDIDAGMGMEVAEWQNFNLGPKDRVTFTVEYDVQDGDQNLINQVTVKRGGDTLGGDTADEIKVVEPAPSVTVEKTPVLPENGYVAGDDVQWIITVTNNTKYPVEGLSLTDTLAGVTVEGTLDYTNFALAAERKTSFTATLAKAPAGTYTNAVVVSKDGNRWEDEATEVKVSGLFTVTYTDGVSGTAFANQTYSNRVEGTATPAFSGTPTREGYVFNGWSPAVAGTVTGNVTYTAQWVSATVPNPSFTVVKTADRTTASVGDVITYTITVTNNGNVDLTNIVVSDRMMENGGTTIASLPVGGEPVVFTYTHTVTAAEAGTTLPNTVTVSGTNPNPGQEDPVDRDDTVNTDINPIVVPPIVVPPIVIPDGPTPLAPGGDTILDDEVPLAAPGLNSTDHFDYVKGYEDGTVRPEANITRAEVATIFFRLMTTEFRMENWATENSFSDVAFGTWYNNAISTATKAGILTGYPEGDFRPENSITRAEFASIAARFASEEVTQRGRFSDIQGHWAEENIERAAAAGWITGSEGKFRPDDYITRAEVIVAVNRMLDRVPDEEHLLDGMKTFVDNVPGMWYYADVQEATNSHDYDRDETGISEIWTELKPDQDWTALEKEWADAAAANIADVAAGLNGGSESEGETEGEAETEAKTED